MTKMISRFLRSLARGAGSAFNLFPPIPWDYGASHETVEDALRSDWEAVGGDMRRAMDVVGREIQAELDDQGKQ